MEKEFDFVIAEANKIEVETTQIVEAAQSTAIEYKVLDANGLDIIANVEDDITFETTGTINPNGEITNLTNDGDAAFVYVVYKAGTDDEVKSARITVKAESAKAVKLLSYTTGTNNFTADNFEVVTTVPKTTGGTLTIFVEDQFGKNSVEKASILTGAEYESLNKEVALVNKTTGAITPLKEGNFDVRIKVGDINVVRPLKAVADSKVAELSLEDATINVSDKVNQSVDVVVKDQYGNKLTNSETITATIKTGSNIIGLNTTSVTLSSADTATFVIQPVAGKEGTATVEFAIGDVKTTLTVNVAKAGIIDSYVVEGAKDKLDIYASNKDERPQAMTLKVFGVDADGVKVGNALDVNASDYDVELKGKDKDGNNNAQPTVDGYVNTSGNDAVITPLTVGTYTLTVKVGSITVEKITFEVVDTEPAPIVTQTTSTIKATGNVGEDIISKLQAALELTIDGKDFAISKLDGITFISDNTDVIASGTDVSSVLTLKEGTATLAISEVKISSTTPELTKEVAKVNLLVNVTVADETAPTITALDTSTSVTGFVSDEALFLNGVALTNNQDVSSLIETDSAAQTISSAVYTTADNTITVTLSEAAADAENLAEVTSGNDITALDLVTKNGVAVDMITATTIKESTTK